MAWPPVIPPATRANTTAQLDTHPADHNAISTALTALVGTAWQTFTMAAGWTPLGGEWGPTLLIRRDGVFVYLAGTVAGPGTNPANGAVIATIPAGFRPPYRRMLMALGAGAACRVDLYPDGRLVWISAIPTAAAGVSATVTLNQLMWDLA